jgi:hypothetical protein
LRRLRKAADYYKEHIQLLPITKAILLKRKGSSGASGATAPATAEEEAEGGHSRPRRAQDTGTPRPESAVSAKSLAPKPVLLIMRWIISFQMLLEMRLMAAEKSKQRRQQLQQQPLPLYPQHTQQQRKGSAGSHASKYLFSCDELLKLSQNKNEFS